MNGAPLLLTGCSFLLLIAGSLLVLRRQRVAVRSVTVRLDEVTAPFVAAVAGEKRARRRGTLPRRNLTAGLERALGYHRSKRSHATVPIARVTAACAGLGLGVGWAMHHLIGTVGWMAVPACVLGLSRLFYGRRERQYCDKLFKQFPDALGMIVRAVRVGVGVGNAIALVATESQEPTRLEFKQLSEEIAIGLPLPDALRAMSLRNGLPEYHFFATALTLQSQTGGGLSETLETLADTIRKRVAIKLRGHALAAEARISCYVLGGLPFAVGAGLLLLDPDYVLLLFTSGTGQKLLLAAIALLVTGLTTMQMITKRTLR